MNYKYLIESAGKIPPAGKHTCSEYQDKRDTLIAEINRYMLNRDDLHQLIGKNNVNLMKNNHLNHVLFINSILRIPDPVVLVDTIIWVFRTYSRRGFTVNYWNVQTRAWLIILKDQLSLEAYSDIIPLYNWIQENIPTFKKLAADKDNLENSLH